jgi:precorrin-2 methylase
LGLNLVTHKFKQKVLNFSENSHMVKYSKFWYVTQSMRLAASNLTSVVAAISASQTAAARSAIPFSCDRDTAARN